MQRYTDEQIDTVMGRLLRAGVIAAAALMVAGALLYFYRHGSDPVAYRTFHGVPGELKTLDGILRAITTGRGRALMQLGALVMIATPVMRVAFAVYAFARENDRVYVAISLAVLAVLAYGLFATA